MLQPSHIFATLYGLARGIYNLCKDTLHIRDTKTNILIVFQDQL